MRKKDFVRLITEPNENEDGWNEKEEKYKDRKFHSFCMRDSKENSEMFSPKLRIIFKVVGVLQPLSPRKSSRELKMNNRMKKIREHRCEGKSKLFAAKRREKE